MNATRWCTRGAVAVLVLATAGARADKAEDAAAEAIKNTGGQVIRDDKLTGNPVVGAVLTPPRSWGGLQGLPEVKHFRSLRTLDVSRSRMLDYELEEIK